jgi:NAD(P)-dependent dehydrogenase (short-subunit alcohol dehydrogenase family)
MGALEGRVAIVTGGGRGIGRAHAHLFAAEGAQVLVNDVDPGAAAAVVAEIEAAGGGAAAPNVDDVTTWKGGESLVAAAIAAFGDLHVLINNAGYLRDRFIVNMSEEEWDSVIAVHLKGHFVPLHHAAVYWREQSAQGAPRRAAVVNTTSTSGLYGNPGQANYGAAKAGIAALTRIAAQELGRYGVRVNAVVPEARTRLTESAPGLSEIMKAPVDESRFDPWDPANVAPLVAWLGSESCEATGRILSVSGGTIEELTGWTRVDGITKDARWTIEELAGALPGLLDHQEKL